MRYRLIVSVHADDSEKAHAFASRVVELIDEAFDEWPERQVGVYTHLAPYGDRCTCPGGTPLSPLGRHNQCKLHGAETNKS
jgi:hypothetical protein